MAHAVYRFVFFFSLWGVCFLSIMASLLFQESPFMRVSSEFDKATLGKVVLEAAAMYAALMVASGWAWYRHIKRFSPTYSSRVRRRGGHDDYL